MFESLRGHVLEEVESGRRIRAFVLHKPGTNVHSNWLLFSPVGTIIAGDTQLAPHRSVCSAGSDYGLEWFASDLDERYLCEKFLRKEWQPAAAAEEIRNMVSDFRKNEERLESVPALEDFARGLEMGAFDEGGHAAFVDQFFRILPGGDPMDLGMDYPWNEAGWLSAVQRRFRELFRTLHSAAPDPAAAPTA